MNYYLTNIIKFATSGRHTNNALGIFQNEFFIKYLYIALTGLSLKFRFKTLVNVVPGVLQDGNAIIYTNGMFGFFFILLLHHWEETRATVETHFLNANNTLIK